MMFDPTVRALAGAASGVAMAILGFVVWRAGRRGAAELAFASFATLWGAIVVLGNLARMAADVPTASLFLHLFVAASIPLYVPATLFVLRHPAPIHPVVLRPSFAIAIALPALALFVALLARPETFIVRVTETAASGTFPVQGPLYRPVVNGSGALVPAAMLIAVVLRHRPELAPIQRAQTSLVACALLPYVAYQGTRAIAFGSINASALSAGTDLASAVQFITIGAASAVAVALTLRRVAGEEVFAPFVPPALALLPVMAALTEVALGRAGIVTFDSVGPWRLLTVAILAYSIARYQLFDLDDRLRRAAPVGGFLLVSVLGLELLWNAFGPNFADAPIFGILATLGFELMAIALPLWTLRVWHAATTSRDEREHVRRRQIEVYEAALLTAQASGGIDRAEERVLAGLRDAFGITSEDHQRMLASVRRSGGAQ